MSAKELFTLAEKMRAEELLDDAIEKYKKAQEKAIAEGNQFIEAESLHMIGLVLYQQKKNQESSQYLSQAEQLFLDIGNLDMVGAVLRDKAAVAIAEDQVEKAEQLLLKSIEYLEKGNLNGHLGISKVKLGSLYLKKGMMREAEKLTLEGILDIKKSDDRFFESSAYFTLAQIDKAQKRITEAKVAAERALDLLKRVSSEGHEQRKKEFKQFIDELS